MSLRPFLLSSPSVWGGCNGIATQRCPGGYFKLPVPRVQLMWVVAEGQELVLWYVCIEKGGVRTWYYNVELVLEHPIRGKHYMLFRLPDGRLAPPQEKSKVHELSVFHTVLGVTVVKITYEDTSGAVRTQSFRTTIKLERLDLESCYWYPDTGPVIKRER